MKVTFINRRTYDVKPFSVVHSDTDSAKEACQKPHGDDRLDFGDQQFGETKARVRYIITRCDVL